MVKDEMTDVTGRVLQPPSILYGGRVHAGLVGSVLWVLGAGKLMAQQHVSPRGGAVPRGVDLDPGENLVLLQPEPGGSRGFTEGCVPWALFLSRGRSY